MIQIQRFLVPLDGSEISAQIVPWVAALARSMGTQISLLSVVPPARDTPAGGGYMAAGDASGQLGGVIPATGQPPAARGPAGEAPAGARAAAGAATEVQRVDAVRQMAFDYLSAQKAALEEHKIAADVHVASGDPATEIVKAADALGAGAIAMSTRRSSALARGILGSVTDRVLHMADRPMLIMHPREQNGEGPGGKWPLNVIVPLDGSQLSETAVPMATAVARAAGAQVVFVRAMPQVTPQSVSGFTTASEIEYGTELEKERLGGEGHRYLDRFVQDAREAGITAEAQVYGGRAERRIVELAGELPGALVVMTTSGRSGIQRWVLGSVTDKVVRSSGQPVFVLPPIMPESAVRSAGPPPPPPPPGS
jgi:nucleotide-binding universal stress UspA family protein